MLWLIWVRWVSVNDESKFRAIVGYLYTMM
jgi:hypothetical protein